MNDATILGISFLFVYIISRAILSIIVKEDSDSFIRAIIVTVLILLAFSCSKKVHNPEDDWLPLDGMPERTRPDTTVEEPDAGYLYPKDASSRDIRWWLRKLQMDYDAATDLFYVAEDGEFDGEIVSRLSVLIFTCELLRERMYNKK